eukprot:scaffold11398_cov125-Cylindrotheca_fusiformis.AAC.2
MGSFADQPTPRRGCSSKSVELIETGSTAMPVGAGESGSPELATKSDTTASSLILEADREDQIPATLPVTPQVIDDVTPTSDTRLLGAKGSYVEVARSSLG